MGTSSRGLFRCSSLMMVRYIGLGFSRIMKFSHRKGFIDRESYVAQYLALALFTIGIVSTLGSDDLLAAFAAGTELLRSPISPH